MKAEVRPRDLRLAVGKATVATLAKQYSGYRFAVNGCYFAPLTVSICSPVAKDGKTLYDPKAPYPYLAVKGDRAWFGRGSPDGVDCDFLIGGGPMHLVNGAKGGPVAGEWYDYEIANGETRVRQRTIVGLTQAGTVVIIVLKGTFADCRKALLDAGCVSGMNLDGGSSTQWVEDGQTIYGSPRKVPTALVAVSSEPRKCRVYIDRSDQWANISYPVAYGNRLRYIEGAVMQTYGLTLAKELDKRGYEVRLSDSEEHDLGLIADDANAWGADLVVSLHSNAAEDALRGKIAFIVAKGGKAEKLAHLLSDDVRVANYQILRDTDAPAVLVEIDFHSTPEGALSLLDPNTVLNFARQTADAIDKWR